jgi:hypothetical protein
MRDWTWLFRIALQKSTKSKGWLTHIMKEIRPYTYSCGYDNSNVFRHWNYCVIFLIGIVGGGVQLGPLGTAATNRPIVPAPGDYDTGEIGGMIGGGNRSTRRKSAPVPLCPPQTPHATRTRTRAAAVGSQRLTAWTTARPKLLCN